MGEFEFPQEHRTIPEDRPYYCNKSHGVSNG